MMETKAKDHELLLGFDQIWDEYVIVEHHYDSPNHGDNYCFLVGVDFISDGDGALASYDDTFVKIDEKDYRYVLDLFHKAGEEMWDIAERHGQYLFRQIVPGDYIFDGCVFIHIQNISDDRKKLWIERFYYDCYDLNLDTDLEVVEKSDDFDIEQIESDCLLITEEAFHKALNIGKSAILETTDYLRQIYTQLRSQKFPDL